MSTIKAWRVSVLWYKGKWSNICCTIYELYFCNALSFTLGQNNVSQVWVDCKMYILPGLIKNSQLLTVCSCLLKPFVFDVILPWRNCINLHLPYSYKSTSLTCFAHSLPPYLRHTYILHRTAQFLPNIPFHYNQHIAMKIKYDEVGRLFSKLKPNR